MKKYLAECIGTCTLVVLGCGTAMLVGCDAAAGGGYILTALAFGLSIVAMAYCVGNISGCHINPAVSLGVLLSGRMSKKDFWGYVAAQCVGALLGSVLLALIFGLGGVMDMTGGLGSNGVANAGGVWGACLVEVIATFLFVLVVLGTTDAKVGAGKPAGLAIGLALILIHLMCINLTGTSVNPARSIGPALFAGGDALKDLWVFICAPLVGGALSALVWKGMVPKEK